MTYEEIEREYPDEWQRRKADKLAYRYRFRRECATATTMDTRTGRAYLAHTVVQPLSSAG